MRARQVREPHQRQRGYKIPGLHGQGAPTYELAGKVSMVTPLRYWKGGQFVDHVKALAGTPYRYSRIPEMSGGAAQRVLAGAGYRGHNAPRKYPWSVHLGPYRTSALVVPIPPL
jgi:transposase, IS5 family